LWNKKLLVEFFRLLQKSLVKLYRLADNLAEQILETPIINHVHLGVIYNFLKKKFFPFLALFFNITSRNVVF